MLTRVIPKDGRFGDPTLAKVLLTTVDNAIKEVHQCICDQQNDDDSHFKVADTTALFLG